MALSGLDIYKLLPKTNCKECGFPTCLAFAMQIAAKKASLDKCPHVTEEAKKALESAASPPIKLVSIGTDENKIEVGNETVMFRHEETFYHPTGIAILVEDSQDEKQIPDRINKINNLVFERVGQKLKVNFVAIKQVNKKEPKDFQEFVKAIVNATNLAVIIMSKDPLALKAAIDVCKDRRPLIYAAEAENLEGITEIAKGYNLPIVVRAETLEGLADLTQKITSQGLSDLLLDTTEKPLKNKIEDLTHIRRLALKKVFRPLGYPTIALTSHEDASLEILEVASYISKYASIVVTKLAEPWQILPILTVRQNIYTDPQKPLQVEAKVYEIGNVTKDSPVLITTNFSLTYYTVESEVEASKIPSYIISVDTEGMSVLTAWAAEKFTSESITKALSKVEITSKVSHKEIIIPGYVAVLSGKIEEESGFKVLVGPKEASGIPVFLKNLFKEKKA